MNIIDFIEKGTSVPNPNYKKGSKDTLTASPYLVSNNPADAITPADLTAGSIIDKTYGLTQFDIKGNKYDKYGVIVNPNSNKEDLDKQRAKNQAWYEQAWNSLGQILENEIVLGTALGVSNLVDYTANLFKDEPNDYTNKVSEFLEKVQEKNRERLAIYQSNPDKAWQIGDFGWWANNFVSVGSTVSLMIPSMGVAKGLSLISKAAKLDKGALKLLRGVANAGKRLDKGKDLLFKPEKFLANAKNFSESAIAALASRVGEGYMEARDTYNTVYDKALQELNNLTDIQKADLIDRNPEYATMSNEDIAKDLASISGANTFKEDFPLVLIDFLQYKSLNKLYKDRLKNAKVRARTILEHQASMAKLAGQEVSEITAMQTFKEGLLYNLKNPKELIKSIPINEGFEEGWQGIVQAKSEELYKMAIDPSIDSRSLNSYLTDGHIWEQAFWGIVGGAVFQAVGAGIGNIKSEIDRAKENKHLSEQNQKEKITSARARENLINNRFNEMKSLVEKMKALNEGHHYSELETDKNGEPIIVDGETKYKTLDETEVFYEKEKLINEFIDKMVMDYIDAGTYDLTKEFIQSEYFDKYFENEKMEASDIDTYIKDRVKNRLENTKDLYLKNLDVLNTLIDNPFYYSLQLAARDLTKRELSIEAYGDAIKLIDEKLQTAGDINRLTDGSYDRELIQVLKHNLKWLDKQEKSIRESYDKREISKAALNAELEQIAKSRNIFYNSLSAIKNNEQTLYNLKQQVESLKSNKDLNEANAEYNRIFNEITQALYNEQYEVLTDTTRELLRKRAIEEVKKQRDLINLPVEGNAIKNVYENLDYSVTKLAYDRIDKAFALVEQYMNSAEDPNVAYEQLMTSDESLSQELKNALDILKLSSKNGNVYYKGLLKVRDNALNKRKQEAIEAQRVEVNGQEVTDESKESIREQAEQVIETAQTAESPSTGEQEDAFAAEIIQEAADEYRRQEQIDDFVGTEMDRYLSGQTYGLDLIFNDFITKHKNRKQYFEIIKNIKQISFNDANYKAIYNLLLDELIKDHGLDERTASEVVKEQLSSILKMLATSNESNPNLKQKYSILAKQLQYGIVFEQSNEMLSATSIIEDIEAKYKLLDQMIQLYRDEVDKSTGEFDVDGFFEYILENEEIDFAAAATIFNYFNDYRVNRNLPVKNNYTFTKFKNNPVDFFNKLREIKSQREAISDYMHIRASRRRGANYEMAIAAARRGEKVYLRQQPDHTENIQIMCMGVEIGVITKTKATNNKNTRFKKTINTSGLWWEVTKTEDGYISNYDDFFKALFEGKDKNSKELIALLNSGEALSDIELLKAAIADVTGGNLIIEEIERQNRNKKGSTTIPSVIKEIKSILNYSRETDAYYSYQSWLKKVFENYQQTKQIADILKENSENTVIVDFKHIGVPTPYYVKENVDVASQPFVAENNVVVAIDKNGQIITEKGSYKFNPATIFNTGTMGFLLNNANGNPILARFAEANGVEKGTELYKALYDYLKDIFTKYQTNENYTINNLYEDLLEVLVLRKQKGDTEFNPLFTGYTIVKINGGIAIAKALPYGQKEGKTPFVLAIYDKKYTKKEFDKEAGETRSYTLFNEEGKPYANIIDGVRVSFSTYNPLYINGIVEDIISGLRFNRSMTFITNKNEKDVKTNKHFYKENGKLYIEFGDKKIEYDSYFQFIMKNNAFKVNVEAVNGSFTYNSSESDDFYISVDKIEPGKTSYEVGNPQAEVDKALDLIQTATTESAVSSLEVLDLIGINTEKYKPWVDNGLFTDELYYDDDGRKKGHAATVNGKIVIRKKGIELLRRNPQELLRLITHEQLHLRIGETNIFERKAIINDLLDTYNQFIKAVEEKAANGDREALILKNWIKENNFKPNKEFIKDDKDDREFVEEWLVESITNQPITQFLNKIQYEGVIETTEKKSILQRIIDIILDLFGLTFDNVNKSSILAKQLSLLNENVINTPTNITTSENGESIVNSPVEEEPLIENNSEQTDDTIETEPEEGEELFDYESDEEDDFLSATIPFIELDSNQSYIENALNDFADNPNNNPNGYIMVNDMEQFIESYPVEYRSKIRTLLDTGAINFICR